MSSTTLSIQQTQSYRWVILALCALTPLFAVTLPNRSLPPQVAVIGDELKLALVEAGAIRCMGSFAGICFSLIGGTLGARFGARATLFVACLFAGLFGPM